LKDASIFFFGNDRT